MQELYVAIDLGSSKFIGAVGTKDQDGKINILCVEEIQASGMKSGKVFNQDNVSLGIKQLIALLDNRINKKLNENRSDDEKEFFNIKRFYVGLNGKSINTSQTNAVRNLNCEEITKDIIDALINEAKHAFNDLNIIDIVPQEYNIDDEDVTDPISVICKRIEGRYRVVTCDKTLEDNLTSCIDRTGYSIAGKHLAISAAAEVALTDDEKEIGSMLIDFGAETISMAIYHNNILRYARTLPFGSSLLSSDIATEFKFTRIEAENIKIKCGRAMFTNRNLIYSIKGKEISSDTLEHVFEARIDQFIGIINQCLKKSGYERAIGNIVLTGGGAKMPLLKQKFEMTLGHQVRINIITKEETNVYLNSNAVSADLEKDYTLPKYITVLGLLSKASEKCVETKEKEKKKETKTPPGGKIKSILGGLSDLFFGTEDNS